MWSKTGRLKCWYYSESSPHSLLGNSDREKQGGTVITDTGKSKRETHPGESGIAGKRSRQLRKQPGGEKRGGGRHKDTDMKTEEIVAEASGEIFKARADEKKEGERTIKKSSHHLLPQRETC